MATNQLYTRKRTAWISAGLLALTACGGGNKNAQQQGPPPITPVTAVRVTKGVATYYDEFPATVTAVNQVDIRPQVSGYITGIFFKEGSVVRKGQKLYAIDQRQYRAGYDAAVANLRSAQANLIRAQKDADRYTTLLKEDAVARQLADNAQATLVAAREQVASAQSAVQQQSQTLSYATIYAPFTGTIGISQVKLGTAVTPGSTVLNTISSDNPIAADITVDQKNVLRFTTLAGQPSDRLRRDSTFRLQLPDGTMYAYPGSVGIIDRAVDPQTGTLRVRLFFPNSNSQLKPGLTANVEVKNQTPGPQLLIPYQAVTEQMSEYFVYVAEQQKDTLRAVQRKLTLGARINDKVVVQNGLREGDEVITEGTQKLRDGAPIRLGPPAGSNAERTASADNGSPTNGRPKSTNTVAPNAQGQPAAAGGQATR